MWHVAGERLPSLQPSSAHRAPATGFADCIRPVAFFLSVSPLRRQAACVRGDPLPASRDCRRLVVACRAVCGPRSSCDGWTCQQAWRAVRCSSHESPALVAVFQPWKSPVVQSVMPSNSRLQWGHGFSAVEMPSGSPLSSKTRPLQWGHGFSAVEMIRRQTSCSIISSCFNGATAFQPWKWLASQLLSPQAFTIAFSSGLCPVGGRLDT